MSEFAKYIADNRLVFKYAKGKSIENGREFHNYHEILYFIEGDAEFITEDKSIKLKPRTLLVIPKERYHQFSFERTDNYHRCVFNFFESESLSILIKAALRDILILSATRETEYLFKKLMDLSGKTVPEETKIAVMYSVLTLMLHEISETDVGEITGEKFHSITRQSLGLISSHLKESISVNNIAKMLNVSVSSLAHTFKRDMKIPIYKFIQEKKLILANRMINSGTPATLAATECGFRDYSGFYRQYKAMFGCSPSKTEGLSISKD